MNNYSRMLSAALIIILGFVYEVTPADTIVESCPQSVLDDKLHLTVPCAGVYGLQYRAELSYIQETEDVAYWRVKSVGDSTCAWNIKTCATVDENLRLTIPGVLVDNVDTTISLEFYPDPTAPDALSWTHPEYRPSQVVRGKIDSHGTLLPYNLKKTTDGTGRKLLALYMVGSNLESGSSQAATTDLFELIGGYRKLTDPKKVDIIVAFGGSTKDHWQGMKFANISQLLEDANDARFGNEQNYLYRSDQAHMGDISSLKHFLRYIRDAYVNYDSRFLVMWDHGASYLGYGNDEFYNMEPLSLPEIEEALIDSGQHFNLLGFDACLMASLETAKYIHPYADYLLASEDTEPGHGWNWTEVITAYSKHDEVVTASKAIIDNYVENSSHPRQSSGKTLSLADLSHFPEVEAALVLVLNLLNARLTTTDSSIVTTIEKVMQGSRVYSNSYNISVDLKDALIHLESVDIDSVLKEKVALLQAALKNYLLYSRHDGTRPYSYGAAIDRLDNPPYPVNVNEVFSETQRNWQTVTAADESPPQASASDKVEITRLVDVNADELTLLRNYIDSSGFTSAVLEWWERAYQIMAAHSSTLDDKLKAVAALENESKGVFEGDVIRRYYLNKGVEITRVEIADMPRVEIVGVPRVEITRSSKNRVPEQRTAADFIAKPIAISAHLPLLRSRLKDTLPVPPERAAFTVLSNNNEPTTGLREATTLN